MRPRFSLYHTPSAMRFAHLHNHSDYSMLDGAVPVKWYVQRAKELGMQHLGLTDHGNLFGVIPFEQACRQAGINPVIGCEIYVAPGSRLVKNSTEVKNYHLTLYCRDRRGYRNLLILVSKGFTEGFYYKPRIDDALLEEHHEGLIASSGCLSAQIPRLILEGKTIQAQEKALFYRGLFGEGHFYLEVMNHGLPEEETVRRELKVISHETGIPLIATNDVHYLHKDHANAQDILICIGTNKKKADTHHRMKMKGEEYYFKTPEEMAALFPEMPEALENTVRLAEQCDLVIPKPGPILPDYVIPEAFATPDDYLAHLAWQGVKERYREVTSEIEERMRYEIGVLTKMGFTGYFLIVWDFIHWAKLHDIPVGPGRGSGSGSLVAYALKITDIDPLQYGLLFERFLNPERISMPDFDIDFCFERRGEVIGYVMEKYGADQVAGICTFGTLKAKAAIKDIARVLDIPFNEANELTKLVPDRTPEGRAIRLNDALHMEPKLREYSQREGVYKELFETACILEGMNRHVSTHACGMVIGKTRLTDYVPLYKDQKTGAISSGYSMDIIEECGLVKMDFLGLKTLTLLENTSQLIRKREPGFDMETIREDDEATFAMLGRGQSKAIFQFESQGMQDILRKVKPNSIEDLIALNALYRPGPMRYIPQFIEAKKEGGAVIFPDEALKEILKPTYGVMIYQEQVIETARIVGGLSAGRADILRRAMGKKKEKEMEEMKLEFLEGAVSRGYSRRKADSIFEMLKPFAGYGFNKSHAAAYAVIAYKTAYCRANYPAEFMAANLTNEVSQTDHFNEYLAEAKEMGISVRPPDINLSEKDFSVTKGEIFYGMMGIKGLGSAAVDEILRVREAQGEFRSFAHFVEEIPFEALNRKGLEAMILAGLFDRADAANRATLAEALDGLLPFYQRRREESRFGQGTLFSMDRESIPPPPMEEKEEWPVASRLAHEKQILGFYVSGHPLDPYKAIWEKKTTLKLTEAKEAPPEKRYALVGLVRNIRFVFTRRGEKMAYGLLEDYLGAIELIFFTRVLQQGESLLKEEAMLLLEGRVDRKRGIPSFVVDRVEEIGAFLEERARDDAPYAESAHGDQTLREEGVDAPEERTYQVHIQLEEGLALEAGALSCLCATLEKEYRGKDALFLHLGEEGDETVIRAASQIRVRSEPDALAAILKNNPLIRAIWKE